MEYSMKKYSDYVSTEVPHLAKQKWLVLPTGSVEQHSYNLPLSVDIDIANAISKELSKLNAMVVAPSLYYGVRSLPNSGGGNTFPGTIYIDGNTYTSYVRDVIQGYIHNGFHKILILNAHYENYIFLCEAAELLKLSTKYKVIILNWWDLLDDNFMKLVTDDKFINWESEHAGVVETAIESYIKPKLIKNIDITEEVKQYSKIYSSGIKWMRSDSGALSSNIGANPKMGRQIVEKAICEIDKLIKTIERNEQIESD